MHIYIKCEATIKYRCIYICQRYLTVIYLCNCIIIFMDRDYNGLTPCFRKLTLKKRRLNNLLIVNKITSIILINISGVIPSGTGDLPARKDLTANTISSSLISEFNISSSSFLSGSSISLSSYEPHYAKTCLWGFSTRSDSNQSAHLQKLAGVLKFRI